MVGHPLVAALLRLVHRRQAEGAPPVLKTKTQGRIPGVFPSFTLEGVRTGEL